METATFGGGCFWCIEALIRLVDGVEKVVSGFAGGNCPGTPTYREVSSGKTGHAEVVQVTFDTTRISYETLLEVFMENHNPTVNTYIKGDYGSQYRSIILFETDVQQSIAQKVVQKYIEKSTKEIRTEIEKLASFYTAEAYHQDYFNKNKEAAYCEGIIAPKIEKLKNNLYKT
ncbi:peptide-methionine (S)-S-oxide reductase MsrA [Cellulophaga baltica]|uniref:peptide-methionine (S)-S-oxide reductase MsrA n=1 Tax=Cellulophaga baltica TaxID=76594 RepID=UPI0028738F09|nr:peptide-methionine (S)-S-oxide reductase MsrA [Cellulophaga baltica]